MAGLRTPELLIILLLVIVLFGAKRLPDAARGLGRSLRIFKSEMKADDQQQLPDKPSDKPSDNNA